MGGRGCKVKVPAEGPPRFAHQFSGSSPGAAVLRTALKQLEGSSVKLPPIDFFFLCISHQRASKIWAEVIPVLAPVWAPSQAHTVKCPHWHCYSDHSSTEKDAGCAQAWLSLGPNLLSILQGSNHNNGRLAKSREVGGLFIWLNKPSLNAQITTTGSNRLQWQSIVFLPTSTWGSNNNKTLQKHL